MAKNHGKSEILVTDKYLRSFISLRYNDIHQFLNEYHKLLISASNNTPQFGYVFEDRISRIDTLISELNEFVELPF